MVSALEKEDKKKSDPNDAHKDDGIFFLGKRNSGLVILGSRLAIKHWTSSRLEYEEGLTFGILNRRLQVAIRIGTILVLLFVFVTVPNGSTTDQLVFILLNVAAQANVFIGIKLNALSCVSEFDDQGSLDDKEDKVKFRTQVYGYLIRDFHGKSVDPKWIEKSEMLPKTDVWDTFTKDVISDWVKDPRDIYEEIAKKSAAAKKGQSVQNP